MKNPLKIIKKISSILAWLTMLVRVLAAIKNALGGDNPGDDGNQLPEAKK